jgi:hypothetical protein
VKGDRGAEGPPGAGLVRGSLLMLAEGVAAPAGYSFVGLFTLQSEDGKKNGGRHKNDDLVVRVYRRN